MQQAPKYFIYCKVFGTPNFQGFVRITKLVLGTPLERPFKILPTLLTEPPPPLPNTTSVFLLCELYKFLHKLLIDAFLHEYATSGETDLSLVGKGRSYHCRETFVQVHIIEHNTSILTT